MGQSSVLVHNDCTYSRVQGGDEGTNNFSKETIKVNTDGSINITNKNSDLYVSIGNEHAEYFLGVRGENAYIVQFDLPDWVDETIRSTAIPQRDATQNIFNDYLPKLVDSTTPGQSYQLPSSWLEFIESVAYNGRVL